mmetsp:Transcript_18154/g.20954  ORF Transcript_18154/g.20954 Transcript_18154/m.20954 type:complete len:210 (-) Transcript_18154:1178-1807(-)
MDGIATNQQGRSILGYHTIEPQGRINRLRKDGKLHACPTTTGCVANNSVVNIGNVETRSCAIGGNFQVFVGLPGWHKLVLHDRWTTDGVDEACKVIHEEILLFHATLEIIGMSYDIKSHVAFDKEFKYIMSCNGTPVGITDGVITHDTFFAGNTMVVMYWVSSQYIGHAHLAKFDASNTSDAFSQNCSVTTKSRGINIAARHSGPSAYA